MEKINLKKVLKEIEINAISEALQQCNNSVTKAAKLLGMQRTGLSMAMKRLNLSIEINMIAAKKAKTTRINTQRRLEKLLLSHPNNIEDQLW